MRIKNRTVSSERDLKQRANMQRGFGGTALEPLEERRDKELTLGPTMLLALVVGLFALCSLCFVFGYAVGHRGGSESAAAGVPLAAGGQAISQPYGTQSKPSATQSGFQPQQQKVSDGAAGAATDEAAAENPDTTDAPRAASIEPVVHSALSTPATAAQKVPAAGLKVAPALPQPSALMVQIAAVTHPEDAEVLVGALRRRGYAVAVRRDPTDGLLHVQIGPFATRVDATAMRIKLLNDGYNAIIQP
jgi:DedD protein